MTGKNDKKPVFLDFLNIRGRIKKYKGLDRMSRNVAILALIIAGLIVAIFYNLLNLMIINNDEYQQAAASQQLKNETLPANRGTIYDANGEKLVQSAAAWVVCFYPELILEEQKDEICQKISEVLGVDYQTVLAKTNAKYNGVTLTVKADKDQKDVLMAFLYRTCYIRKVTKTNEEGKKYVAEEAYLEDHPDLNLKKVENYHYIKGVTLLTDTKRYYYHDTHLASTVLGFTNSENTGGGGIEGYYDSVLKGVDGKIIKAKNSVGGEMPFEYDKVIDPIDGNSLRLTIDANVQATMEKYLRQAVVENDVQDRAVGIMMNVNSGAILGMAVIGDYDVADYLAIADEKTLQQILEIEDPKEQSQAYSDARNKQWRNKAISDAYEPGSVFKPITMAAALEEGVAAMSDTFNCPGYRVVAGRTIRCHKSGGHGEETLTQGMMNSCNPVLMTLGERLGAANFHKYFTAFGLTAPTGIDLPGEGCGSSSAKYSAVDLAVSTFGQRNTVTPIQMITAFAAACNGGYLVKPYVVDKVLDAKGNIVQNHQTVIKRQVISAATSKNINTMLEATAGEGGTAHNVYLKGYRIGAKTGTSEKIAQLAVSEDKDKKKYIASFCAVAPIDDPEIAILVLFDEPNNPRSHGGGKIVAPVVRNILSEVLPYLGVDTIYSENDARLLDTLIPNVVGKSTEEATEALEAKGLTVRVIGEGSTVTGQIPSGAKSAPKSSTVVITTESDGEVPMTTVPDLVGRSPTGVASAVRDRNLNIRYSGTGYESSSGMAKSQDIPAGSLVEQGTVVTVEFIVEGITD